MFKILVVEDDTELNQTVCSFLIQPASRIESTESFDVVIEYINKCGRGYIRQQRSRKRQYLYRKD